eukprot:10276364-Prorocentrum_lima.AAC.1
MVNKTVPAHKQLRELGRRILSHHKRWTEDPEYRLKQAAMGGTPYDLHRGIVLPWTPMDANSPPPDCSAHDVEMCN